MISVIIPTYNRSACLENAVHSVLNQTRPAEEIIIVDDGSVPMHQKELERIAAKSPLITMHRLPANQGVAQARNYGITVARGDYLLFLDDDDAIHQEMLAAAMAMFSKDETLDVVTFGCQIIGEPPDNRGNHFINFLFINKGFSPRSLRGWLTARHQAQQAQELQRAPFSALLKSCPAMNACVIRKRTLSGCVFLPDLKVGEDWYFWLSIAARGARFTACPLSYAFVRRHRSNATASVDHFFRDMTPCLLRIETSGMLRYRSDRVNVQARLSWASLNRGEHGWTKYLIPMMWSPGLALRMFAYYFIEKL